MKKIALFICFLPLLKSQSVCQSTIDSLKASIAYATNQDTNLAMTYRHLFRAYYADNLPDEMLETAEKGLALSRQLNFERGIDYFLFYKASALDILGRGREAIPLFEEGIQLALKRGDEMAAADYHINTGTAWHSQGEFDKAMKAYYAAHDIYQKRNEKNQLSKLLNNIGVLYKEQGKSERAEEIYRQSLAIKTSLKDILGIAATYQNLAALLSSTPRSDEAIAYLHKSLAIYEKEKAADDVAGCHSLLGEIYFNQEKFTEAKTELKKALEHYGTNPSVEYVASTYQLLGTLALTEKNYLLAEQYLLSAIKFARQFGQRELLYGSLNALSKAQKLLGKNVEAFDALREASAIRDSVTEEKRLRLLEEMQAKFDVTQKNNELKISSLKLAQRTLQNKWLLAGALLMMLLALAIFVGLRARIHANKKITEQAAEIQTQRIQQLEQENKLTALASMLEGQEQERARIASDLHDSLGGLLASIKSHFNALKPTAEQPTITEKTNYLIDEAATEVRRISHNMMPRALVLAGLNGALQDLALDLKSQGVDCDLELFGLDDQLEQHTSLTIYRIVQELAHNVIKHAHATHLLLQLLRNDGLLTIIAEDNGKGFNVQEAIQKKGLGLANIESRVKLLNGSIEWDAVPEEGTTVSISIPL